MRQRKLSALIKFSLVFKNKFYAFQPKQLIEHHVYVPLPHVVKFHLENNGFEILEAATIGNIQLKKFKISLHYIKDLICFLLFKVFCSFKTGIERSYPSIFCSKEITQNN